MDSFVWIYTCEIDFWTIYDGTQVYCTATSIYWSAMCISCLFLNGLFVGKGCCCCFKINLIPSWC